ncbi:hypothetical protein L5G28_06360 [Gordonia sp. HY285]|uniref:hypothetical protein n=1 Tax=Gordonia liuliyuniae TaxID=2911517 RepID=UPI001F39E7CA|nr:hypothetical protein [Gordonia liuliyuniae]MCF8609785.1 hypothetical protein [Gordonia liuliyuniae]
MIQSLIAETVGRAVALPGKTIRFVLSEALTYLTEEIDLTGVLLTGVDLNRIVATLDVNAVIEKIDLNKLLETVDLNTLLETVDLNAVLDSVDLPRLLARLDLDALLADLDLDALLDRVDVDALLDGVDISSMVRGASTTVTTEMITDVRGGSERADDAVENLVGRMLRRKARDE